MLGSGSGLGADASNELAVRRIFYSDARWLAANALGRRPDTGLLSVPSRGPMASPQGQAREGEEGEKGVAGAASGGAPARGCQRRRAGLC